MSKPMVGEKVEVQLRSNGNGKLSGSYNVVQHIVAVYPDGTVRTDSGDTWAVRPHRKQSTAQWYTCH